MICLFFKSELTDKKLDPGVSIWIMYLKLVLLDFHHIANVLIMFVPGMSESF